MGWDGFTFEGAAVAAQVVARGGVLRFHVLRVRSSGMVGTDPHSEEAFTSNLDMDRDFFAKGCPKSLAQPVFHRSGIGEMRHVGHLHVAVQVNYSISGGIKPAGNQAGGYERQGWTPS